MEGWPQSSTLKYLKENAIWKLMMTIWVNLIQGKWMYFFGILYKKKKLQMLRQKTKENCGMYWC